MTGVQAAFQELIAALGDLHIPYMVGGSIASAVRGIPRLTNAIDLVAAITPAHVAAFASRISAAFYVDSETIREALEHKRSFNVIHLASGSKFDIFPAAGIEYLEMQIERSKLEDVPMGKGLSVRCPVATAEDTILAKLVWYRLGREQSDRQWNDVRGIRAVQGDALDRTYMQQWARELKVDDLLERLFSEELLPE